MPSIERPIRSVAIAVKHSNRAVVALALELARWLQRRNLEVQVDDGLIRALGLEGLVRFSERETRDLIVVLGGDGTLLSVARNQAGGVPILGVNMGTLGFLTEVNRTELFPALVRVLAGQFEILERTLFNVELERAGSAAGSSENGTNGPSLALSAPSAYAKYAVLNDVVVNKSALARIIRLSVSIGGRPVADYRADGLIVSTPTGSTAYNLSAGGPIIEPGLGVAVLTPICPHTLSMRPLVVPDSSTIKITLDTPEEEVYLTLDGQEGVTLGHRDSILIRVADETVRLVRVSERTFYDSLREKLKWGE